ncbi:MAG: class I SAM-dependent methyltransferase [Planctomycetes bacterium]|nr:class I SAM-dependent methyltransferase [Planctomycetota bacterium]
MGVRRIDPGLLRDMGDRLAADDRDEMAIPSYLHRNPLMRWMAWRRIEVTARRIERCDPECTIMDFGCGTGVLFDAASRVARRVYGVDPVLAAAEMLVEQWALDKVVLLTPDEASTRIEPGSVDLVLAAEVLEHVDPLAPTLEFFRQRLAPNGRLLTSMPTENALYRFGRRLAGFHGEYHHHDARSIDAELRRCGFVRRYLERVPAPGPLAIYWVAEYEVGGERGA